MAHKTTFEDALSGDEVTLKSDLDHVMVQLGPDGISASFRLTPEDALTLAQNMTRQAIDLLVYWAKTNQE